MKRFFQFLAVSALGVLIMSCSKEDSIEQIGSTNYELKLRGDIKAPISATRVNANGFESNDKVGVYVSATGSLASQGNTLDNAVYTYSNGNLNAPAGSKIYWDSKDAQLSVYAYYPYAASVTNNSAYEFSVEANQSITDNFYNSDFITAKAENLAPQETPVELTFTHSLSKIMVSFVAGKGITSAELAAAEKMFTISGLAANGTINLATGVATAGTTKTTISPLKNDGGNYAAIVYPQEGAVSFNLTLDGEVFSYTTNIDFEAGYQYQFNLTINTWESPEMSLTSTSIDGWNDGDDHSGTMSNALSFPDPAFNTFLLNADKYTDDNFQETDGKVDANGDGKISKEEADAVLFLNASNGQQGVDDFTNIEGIEYFVNLQGINLDSHTSLTSINVSKNTKLTYLKVSACPVSSIDVSNNTSLEWLYCYNCGLTKLDLSNNPNLKYVDCQGNANLTTIHIAEGVNYQTWSIQSGVTPIVKSI